MRIGILLDKLVVPQWVDVFLNELMRMTEHELVLVVLNQAASEMSSVDRSLTTYAYRALRWLDRKVMPLPKDPFVRKTWNPANIPQVRVNPIRTKFSDRFSPSDLDAIRAHNPDILIRFGFRILRGDILTVAPWGIISLHHGDTSLYRGGPPAFWEVVDKAPVTAVTAQRITEELDGGDVISKAFVRTDFNSFFRNQARVYWVGTELLLQVFKRPDRFLYPAGTAHFDLGMKAYDGKMYRNPKGLTIGRVFFTWLFRNISRKWLRVWWKETWEIRYRFSDSPAFVFFRFHRLTPPKGLFWADPFVIKYANRFYLFFEELLIRTNKGRISYVEFDANGRLVKESSRVALEIDHHLSYPFIWQDGQDIFMMPEQAASRRLDVYKATNFPSEWKPVKTLLSDTAVYDATMFQYEGIWYLWANIKRFAGTSSDVFLELYYSPDWKSKPFVLHPMSPLSCDARSSRSAGAVFECNGRIYRPVQIGAPRYGFGIRIEEIIVLTPEKYESRLVTELHGRIDSFTKGLHTYNSQGGFSVIDVQRNRFRF